MHTNYSAAILALWLGRVQYTQKNCLCHFKNNKKHLFYFTSVQTIFHCVTFRKVHIVHFLCSCVAVPSSYHLLSPCLFSAVLLDGSEAQPAVILTVVTLTAEAALVDMKLHFRAKLYLYCSTIVWVKYCNTTNYVALHFILIYWSHQHAGCTPLFRWEKKGMKSVS